MSEEYENLDSSTSIGNIIETGDDEEVRSILGDREKIRYAGIIRAGAKVPKNSCTPAEKAKFKELEAQGMPYDEIDKALGGKPKSKDSKLFPTNVDHFIIRDCDFRRPADAEYIRQRYADDDGKVRRIPCWLTMNERDKAIPHNHRAFDGGGNVTAYSYYEGKDLMLKYVPKGTKHPYPKESWKTVAYDPDKPPADAPGDIKFGGLYKVNVPGLRGMGEIIVPTNSWYGLSDAVAQLRRVKSILGRFNLLLNGEPFLELCKVEEVVKTPDGKKQKQWIITLEVSVDPVKLARHAENLESRGQRAIGLFNGATPAATTHEPPPAHVQQPEPEEPAPPPSATEPPGNKHQEDTTTGEPSERRKRCLAYMTHTGKLLQLAEGQMELFAAISNFGATVENLTDDEIAAFCNSMKATMAAKEPETVKNDILAAIGA